MHKRFRTMSVAALSVITFGALPSVSQGDIDWPKQASAVTHAAGSDGGIDWPKKESAFSAASAGNEDIDWP
ncbi:hypothetical protein CTU88_34480 [Streptomyces sp. JV178]|uniref:hypothetical protein n=1 Tax=Streptomyces sp. JV178 TaxID=858632 RepID=UPI000C1B377D|nr:hypothetical protein [Streptomyces sp. JV178]PIM67865.1 hypothetical protein CTU88_34480 [Streptomyces sp. JV178]